MEVRQDMADLSLQHVCKIYSGGVEAVSDLTLKSRKRNL
jgi:hypothetical protein